MIKIEKKGEWAIMTALDTLDFPKAKLTQLKNKGIETTHDLLRMVPLHYYDFSKPTPIKELVNGHMQAIYVQIIFIDVNDRYMKVMVEDEQGDSFDIVFFNQFYLADKLQKGEWYTIGGKVQRTYAFFSMSNPTYIAKGRRSVIQKKYSKVKGMSEAYLQKIITTAIAQAYVGEDLGKDVRDKFNLVDARQLLKCIHEPKTIADVKAGKKRLLFEDLFEFNLRMIADRKRGITTAVAPMDKFELTKQLKKFMKWFAILKKL